MLWNKAMEVLGVSYSTLTRYTKAGKIRTSKYKMIGKMGKTNYWDEDVYALVGRRLKRKAGAKEVAAYFRAGSASNEARARKEKSKDLVNKFCLARGITIDRIYEDTASGARWDYKARPDLHRLIQDIMKGDVAVLIVETKCRITRFGWEMFEELLKYYECELMVLNKVIDDPFYQEEQSDDVAVVLHKMKMDRLPISK